jgi:hypothetical protein
MPLDHKVVIKQPAVHREMALELQAVIQLSNQTNGKIMEALQIADLIGTILDI